MSVTYSYTCTHVCVYVYVYTQVGAQRAHAGGQRRMSETLCLSSPIQWSRVCPWAWSLCFFNPLEACYSQVSNRLALEYQAFPGLLAYCVGSGTQIPILVLALRALLTPSSHPSSPQLAISNNAVITWSHCVLAKSMVIPFIVFLIKRIHKLIVRFDFDSLFLWRRISPNKTFSYEMLSVLKMVSVAVPTELKRNIKLCISSPSIKLHITYYIMY